MRAFFKSHAPAPVPPNGEMWVLEQVMLSERTVVRSYRADVICNARDSVIERANKDSECLMRGLLAKPKLAYALKDFKQIVEILLDKGHQEQLLTLANSRGLDNLAKSAIRRSLLERAFSGKAPVLAS